MNPNGKTALITGGAHRVGRAITLGLAQAGVNVIINYNSSSEAAQKTVAEAEAFGVKAVSIQADVSKPDQVRRMVGEISGTFGGVDILVNNASRFTKTPFPTDDLTLWHEVTGLLINGPFYVSNFLAPQMMKLEEGVIVNIIDLSAWEPWPGLAAHCVGKSALLALTRQLALEMAPNVRVNAVCPGPVLPSPHYDAERIEQVRRDTLLERWGSPEDVVRAVLYFVESDYITGDTTILDGGQRFAHRKFAGA